MKIHDCINDYKEAEGDGGQGGEEHQETEHVGPRNPVQTTVRASHTMNPKLVHWSDMYIWNIVQVSITGIHYTVTLQ